MGSLVFRLCKPGNRKPAAIHSEEGFVLLTAMMIMIAVALLGLAATTTAVFEMQIAGNERSAQEQFFRADSAINEFLAQGIKPVHAPVNLPYPPHSSANPATCANAGTRWAHSLIVPYPHHPDEDRDHLRFFYLTRITTTPFLGEILVCARRGNTVASITAGIEFGLPAGAIAPPGGIGHN